MRQDTQDKLKEIKSRFRFIMNGVVSRSMRDKGIGYKINWGIGLPVLKEMASEYGKDYDLAVELWKEDIRECKILATLIMPVGKMSHELVELWVSSLGNQEIAEMAAFNIFSYLKEAKKYAFGWIASCNDIEVICGYNVLSRLFASGEKLDNREADEFIDQAQTAVADDNLSVRHAAVNALVRFAGIDDVSRKRIEFVSKSCNLDIL